MPADGTIPTTRTILDLEPSTDGMPARDAREIKAAAKKATAPKKGAKK